MAQSHPEKSIRYVTLDVFTRERFKGNPLAIVELPDDFDLEQEAKQGIAREFNLSETVFLHPPSSQTSARKYDIFTSTEELPFAGHPTIGTLVYLGSGRDAAGGGMESITLHAKAGPIKATFNGDTRVAEASIPHNVRIHQTPVPWQSVLNSQPCLKRLKVPSEPSCPMVSIVKGMTFVLIDLPHVEVLASLTVGGPRLDPSAFRWDEGWESFTAPYFYVVISEDPGARYMRLRTRMIEPVCGEDPATGSAASALSSYLALQRGTAGAAYSFSVEQGVEMGRASDIGIVVTLDLSGDAVKEVILSGSAVPVSKGTIFV